MRLVLPTLDEPMLGQIYPNAPFTNGQLLVHVVNHATEHQGQILRMAHDLGAPTFEQDYYYYLIGQM